MMRLNRGVIRQEYPITHPYQVENCKRRRDTPRLDPEEIASTARRIRRVPGPGHAAPTPTPCLVNGGLELQ
jgi:hypothetical protein